MNSVRVWVGHRKTLTLIGIAVSAAIALSTPAEARRHHRGGGGGGYSPPYASIVVDAKTNKILEGENIDAPRIPASITKVMTLYLLFEQLERGRMHLDTSLAVSEYASRQAPTKLGLRPGSTIEVEDAIKAIVTLSANDVAVVIAENIGGSEEAFAQMMTRKARELGMNSTAFYNPHGLPHSPPNITTARDLSVLGRAIQDRFPKYFAYFQTTSFKFGERTIRGHNRLLGKVDGVDGIKTGYTRLSGFNLLTSANTGSRSIVAVVLGGRSAALRDRTMASLVESNLPRAYAGARTTPPMIENGAGAQPIAVADASPTPSVRVEAAAEPEPAPAAPPPPARKPLDLNSLRPVVASAAGASSTTTPSSTGPSIRWQKGPQPLPQNTQAYAAVETETRPSDKEKATLLSKLEDRAPAATAAVKTAALKVDPPKAEPRKAPEPKQAARPAVTEWVIQLGATDDEDKAKAMLDAARAKSGRLLAKASPFTEKVTQKGSTLYRARFSGFEESDDAQKACKILKKNGFACFAARSS